MAAAGTGIPEAPPRFTPLEYERYRGEMIPWLSGGIIGLVAGIVMMRKGRQRRSWLFGGGVVLTSQSLIVTGAVGTAILRAKRARDRYRASLGG